jgi:hypothetical protein
VILPTILGDTNVDHDSLYFGCDAVYFKQFGVPLINSLKEHAPWANIHVHIFNPESQQLVWCKDNSITVSYEIVDTSIKELNTYYACVRFIRIPEIFNNNTRIISLDCDGIAIQPISKDKFLEDTNLSKVLWREKQQKSLASSVFFGPDDFRFRYADKLKSYFDNDSYGWYLDQNIMDQMIANQEVEITTDNAWGWHKAKGAVMILSAKGSTKNELAFQELVKKYNS